MDQFTNTIPSSDQVVQGNAYSVQLSDAGTWYLHIATRDSSGNQNTDHFGPWFAETGNLAAPLPHSSTPWRSSIRINGHLDIAHGEWDPETELLVTSV